MAFLSLDATIPDPSCQHNLTAQAVKERTDPPKRPFVLTRSFYAGSQRFGAMWTGDNLGTWEHMAVGVKMVLANNIGGFSFAGCKSQRDQSSASAVDVFFCG